MLLRYFYDRALAQASYLVGCEAMGEAVVVDPARDITPYLQVAAQANLRIRHVTETHIHADFVSGSRELAAHTGATIYLSQMGNAAWQYDYAYEENVTLVGAGDRWSVGNIGVEVMHTPGHTPEHLAFIITDRAKADQPIGIFTGDFLFVGDVGRPDLLEGLEGTGENSEEEMSTGDSKEAGAAQQFHSIQRFKAMPDYLQIWPGHGVGSACGKALGAIPSTTLGYEKLFNPAFRFNDEGTFVEWLLADQPEIPRYFAEMKRVNKRGPQRVANLSAPMRLTHAAIKDRLEAGEMVFDLRPAEVVRRHYLPGTLNIPSTAENFTTYIGWFVDYNSPPSLILPDVAELENILTKLRAIGVDEVAGYAGPEVVSDSEPLPTIDASEVASRMADNSVVIVDVRGRSEFREKHIRGACNIPLGFLPQQLDQLPRDDTIIVHCSSGYRSQIAASLLRANGFDNVVNMPESEERWSNLLDTVTGD